MTTYRVVCSRVDGKPSDMFTVYDEHDATQIAENAREGVYGEYHRVKIQIHCSKHGWTDAYDGVCEECRYEWTQREDWLYRY